MDFRSERWWTFSVIVVLLGVFSFTVTLRSHYLPLLIFNIRWTLPIITPVMGSIFCISVAFSFSIKFLSNFLFLIKPLSIPSARGLVGVTHTQLGRRCLWREIILLFRSNCPRGVQKRIFLEAAKLCSNSEAHFPTPLGKDDSKNILFLVLHLRFHHQNFRFLIFRFTLIHAYIHTYIFINPRSHLTVQDAKTGSSEIEKEAKKN